MGFVTLVYLNTIRHIYYDYFICEDVTFPFCKAVKQTEHPK